MASAAAVRGGATPFCSGVALPPRTPHGEGGRVARVQQMPNIPAPGKPRPLLPTPTAFPAKQSLLLFHVCSSQLSSLGHLASPGFKPVIYKRCKTPTESLASGVPLSPSLEIFVSPDDSRITPGQAELDKAGSSLLGATCRDMHLWASALQPPIPIRRFRLLGGYSCCKRPGGAS